MVIHPFPPIYDENSKILILGSFPSVQSRADSFYYAHPQNRFWRTLEAVLCDSAGDTPATKRTFLLRHQIALWDVLASCTITRSSDTSIKNAVANDLSPLLQNGIQHIFTNGQTAYKLYKKLLFPHTNIIPTLLPSTSPANAAWSLERLIEAWQIIKFDRKNGSVK